METLDKVRKIYLNIPTGYKKLAAQSYGITQSNFVNLLNGQGHRQDTLFRMRIACEDAISTAKKEILEKLTKLNSI